MKRYIIEMANDFKKRFPDKAEQIMKVRNAYIASCVTEIEAIKALMELQIERKVQRHDKRANVRNAERTMGAGRPEQS